MRLAPADEEALGGYREWTAHRDRLERLGEIVRELTEDGRFPAHPLAVLRPGLAAEERPPSTAGVS